MHKIKLNNDYNEEMILKIRYKFMFYIIYID